MNKIVELLINLDEIEFEEMGVDIMSLVNKPAIGVNWQAFSEQQFVEPNSGESEDEFIGRCIPVLIEEGYDESQAAAICYNYWEGRSELESHECKVMSDDEKTLLLELASSDEFGEILDPVSTVYIDATKESFEDIGEWVGAVRALDILGKRGLKKEEAETKYRYAGPPAERDFCKAMQRLNKLYTMPELEEMGRRVGNGMPLHGTSEKDNIIEWKGGPNCKHYFEELSVFRGTTGQTVIISRGPASGTMGQTLHSMPSRGYYQNSFVFASEEEQIVVGPSMIPNQLIPRRDEMGNIFHVFFSKETIKKIAEKFMKEQKQHNTDVNHNDEVVQENTLLESWIVEDPEKDKSSVYGFNVPRGTWMTSYRINNRETWEKIKSGELNGFSIAGNFIEKIVK